MFSFALQGEYSVSDRNAAPRQAAEEPRFPDDPDSACSLLAYKAGPRHRLIAEDDASNMRRPLIVSGGNRRIVFEIDDRAEADAAGHRVGI
jgi:hypothetical protein